MKTLEAQAQVTNLHLGQSSADLAYGSSKMPRLMLINREGVVAYLGHPEKIDLKDSVETLCKGEPMALD